MPANVAAELLDLVEAAELDQRSAPRFGLVQAGGNVIGDLSLDVIA